MMLIQSYKDAERYLLSTIDETVSRSQPYRLERMQHFLADLDDPHLKFSSIHVAGTSGKGSTCTMLANVLQAAGHKTGLHTKPHLRSMTERARINGQDISPGVFAATLQSMMPAIERAALRGERPSYYETLLALAFCYFANERVDVAVIEVGLGGRLDGTNVLHPLVTAITSIGYDHVEVLGSTLPQIAAEKAGIIKPGIPMVAYIDDDAARAVVVDVCARAGALFIDARQRLVSEHLSALHLAGGFQTMNAMTALAVLDALPEQFRPSSDAIAAGFARTQLPGRMERVAERPLVILDIAHNEQKARALASAIRDLEVSRVRVVVAIAQSKDAIEILAALHRVATEFICTSFPSQPGRTAIAADRLAQIVRASGGKAESIADPIAALVRARSLSADDDLILVTGSTLLVAAVRESILVSELAR